MEINNINQTGSRYFGPTCVSSNTYILVSISGEVDLCHFVFHMYGDTSDVWKHVLVISKVGQQVHNGMTDLKEHCISISNTYQWAWVVCNIGKNQFINYVLIKC